MSTKVIVYQRRRPGEVDFTPEVFRTPQDAIDFAFWGASDAWSYHKTKALDLLTRTGGATVYFDTHVKIFSTAVLE